MAESYSAGRLLVSILPDFRNAAEKVRKEFSGLGPYDIKVNATVDDKALAGLRASLRSLPDVVITADSSPADRELAALRARIATLSSQRVGIDVSADAAHREVDSIRSDLTRLSDESPEISVRVDAAAAEASLQDVSSELGKVDGRAAKITVSADTGKANAALATTDAAASRLNGRRSTIQVIADTGRVLAQIAAVGMAANALANRRYSFTVQADTAGAAAGILRIIALVTTLGGLAGVIGGLGGAIGGLGAAGAVAGAGLGAAVLGFLGVGKALTAMSAQQETAGATAEANAKKQEQAARQVESAQTSLGKATTAANRARVDGAQAVEDAERSASRNIASAVTAQAAAQLALRRATDTVRTAQANLTKAWEEGRRSLQDLQDQVDGNALDQRQAAFDLADAKKALSEAQAGGDSDQIARAQLGLDRQLETIDELNKRTQRGAIDNAKAQKAGVAGTDAYTGAMGQLASAMSARDDAARSAGQADTALNQARLDGTREVAQAQANAARQVSDADAQVIESQKQLTAALEATRDSGTDAGAKVAAAFAALSPEAARFAQYLFGLKPILSDLSGIAAAGLFPPLISGIDTLLTRLPLIKTVVGQLAAGMGAGLNVVLVALASPFWASFFTMLGNAAGTLIPMLFGALMQVAGAVATVITAFMPLAPAGIAIISMLAGLISGLAAPLAQALGTMMPAAQAFITALSPLGGLLVALSPVLNAMGVALSQVLGAALQALTPILVALTPFLIQFAQTIATNLVSSIQAATPFLVMLATWMSENPGLVMGVVGAIITLLGFLKPLSFVLGLVATFAIRAAVIGALGAVFASVGLQGSILAKIVLGILKPFSSLKLAFAAMSSAAGAAGGWMALLRKGVMLIGRVILTALGPVGILITAFGILYASSAPFRDAINGLLGVLMGLIGQIVGAVMPVFTVLGQVMSMVGGVVGMLVGQLAAVLVPVINILSGVLIQLVSAVLPPLMKIIGALLPVIMMLAGVFLQLVMAVVGPLIGALGSLISAILPPLVFLLQNVVVPVITFLANVLATVLTWAITNVLVPAIKFLIPIITGLVNILVTGLVWVINSLVVPALNFLVPIFQWIGKAALWLWQNAIVPAWNAISAAISWAWTNVISPVLGFIWTALRVLGVVIFVILVAPFIIAFNLISAAATWLWTNVLQPVFLAIGTFIGWVWTALIKPVLAALVWFWQNVISPAATWLYNNVILPIFTAIGAIIGFIWNYIIKPALTALVWFWQNVIAPAATWLYNNIIKPMFTAIGTIIEWVWSNVIKPAFDAISGGLDWLGQRFTDATNWIRDIWAKIKGFLAKPINFMINTVWNNGVVPAWNAVAGLVGLGPITPLKGIPENATGGPISGPGTGTSDSILGIDPKTGAATSWVSDGEFVVNEKITQAHLPFLSALNAGQSEARQAAGGSRARMPGYAGGGQIAAIERAKAFAQSQNGKPYQWGGTGNPSWDCSGFMSGVTKALRDQNPFSGRLGTTASMPWGGFTPGLTSSFAIGNSKRNGHMAGTLDKVNVESGGSNGVHYGPPAIGADNGLFEQKWSLPQVGGQFASGGAGGGGGLWNWILDKARKAFDDFTNPGIAGIKALMGEPPPEYRKVPPMMATKIRDTVRDFVFGKAEATGGGGAMGPVGEGAPFIVKQISDSARGHRYGPDGATIGVATGLVESNLQNLGGGDRDSVGVFQQRPSQGWGSIAECMNVLHAANSFFDRFPANWRKMAPGDVAQGVQRSAFPGKYATRMGQASGLVQQFGGPFDNGGLGLGKGIMFKDVMAPERVLDPVETGEYDTLSAYRKMIESGRLVPASNLDPRALAAMSAGAPSGGREVNLHVHGDVVDPVDIDSLYNRLDFLDRSSTL